jgi:hypothetical protein
MDDHTCPACHGSGRIADGDEAVYCDAPGCCAHPVDPAPGAPTRHLLSDGSPRVSLTGGYPAGGTDAQKADWEDRYQRILDDGWLPGEPYVPALYGS